MQDRIRGALFGLACGDAVGTAAEFQEPGSFTPLTDMVGGGVFRLQKGAFTDDTSMALCLAESIIETKGKNDLVDQLERYTRWYEEGHLSSNGECFDIGMTVRSALVRFAKNRDPHSGATHEKAAGNGSLMRLAPAAIAFSSDFDRVIKECGESSRSTHGAELAIDCCKCAGLMIAAAIAGESKEDILSLRYHTQVESEIRPEVKKVIFEQLYRGKVASEIEPTGFSVSCLEAALWAFDQTTDFESGCLLVANLGLDADTSAAIYGQIAGAHYGYSGIPQHWRTGVALKSVIECFADELLAIAIAVKSTDEYVWSEEYVDLRQNLEAAEQAYSKIRRKLLPGPHQYKSLDNFTSDYEEMKKTVKGRVLDDFMSRFEHDKDVIQKYFR